MARAPYALGGTLLHEEPSVHLVMMGVHSCVPWPEQEQQVAFEGHQLRLIPPRTDSYPMVVAEVAGHSEYDSGIQLIRRFLNALAWDEQTCIREIDVVCGGAALRIGNRIPDNFTTQSFHLPVLPVLTDPSAKLALALYREGMSQASKPYQFLSFFKVINVVHANGPAQIAWINGVLPIITEPAAAQRIMAIRASQPDAGTYLYTSGRCAIAHAFSSPVVDPDSPEDSRRLAADLPVMRELAAKLLVDHFGLPAPR